MTVVQVEDATARARLCESVLRALPDWFGIEDAIVKYVDEVRSLTTFAVDEDALLAIKPHSPEAAEIYIMGVRPERQGQGLGTDLVRVAEDFLRSRGVEYLQVKTLGPSRSDEHYARTRRFYLSCGFAPLEELHGLWDEHNPTLIMVKRL